MRWSELRLSGDLLDRRAALEFPLDLLGDASLLSRGVDTHAFDGRSVVAAIAGIGDHPGEGDPDLLSDSRDYLGQGCGRYRDCPAGRRHVP